MGDKGLEDVPARRGARTATAPAVGIPPSSATTRRVIKDTRPGALAGLAPAGNLLRPGGSRCVRRHETPSAVVRAGARARLSRIAA